MQHETILHSCTKSSVQIKQEEKYRIYNSDSLQVKYKHTVAKYKWNIQFNGQFNYQFTRNKRSNKHNDINLLKHLTFNEQGDGIIKQITFPFHIQTNHFGKSLKF